MIKATLFQMNVFFNERLNILPVSKHLMEDGKMFRECTYENKNDLKHLDPKRSFAHTALIATFGLDASIIIKFSINTSHWCENRFPLSVIRIFHSKIGSRVLISRRAYINIGHTIYFF